MAGAYGRPMRIVVVGATGNVGTAVLRRLRREPDVQIVGVARTRPERVPPYDTADWHEVDVAAPDAVALLEPILRGADALVHLAWLLQPNHREEVLARTNVGGTDAVLRAAAEAEVPHVVVASSVGAYSPGPKDRRVDESWPSAGVPSSHYGRQKGVDERMLDLFERERPQVVVTRLRPGLVMQRPAGAELRRLFLGPVVPTRWLDALRVPLLPLPPRVVSQVVHADDLAEAVHRIVARRAGGAFNLAAEPVVTPRLLASVLRSRWVPVPAPVVRMLLDVAWRLRLVRADPGWLDLAASVPVMSTSRAREVLGWRPEVSAQDALREAILGVAGHDVQPGSPHLR
jgi:UDP-glucose 4-epimerase